MKKSTKKRISRLTALVLTLLMLALPLFSVFADGTTIPARVSGIYDNQTYMLKNKGTGMYHNFRAILGLTKMYFSIQLRQIHNIPEL